MRTDFLAILLLWQSVGEAAPDSAARQPDIEDASKAAQAQMSLDYERSDGKGVPKLRDAWLAESNSERRGEAGRQLVREAIWDIDDHGGSRSAGVINEVARDGMPRRLLVPTPEQPFFLHSVRTLADLEVENFDDEPHILFRRLNEQRVEAWTPKEGWLFDAKGTICSHVKVPRRDGDGREWYGAFLSNGRWITTDLWADDRQLNCFDRNQTWLWELSGEKLLASLPSASNDSQSESDGVGHSFGWARADKTGKRWLVSVGSDENRAYGMVDAVGHVAPVADSADFWGLVQPEDMGPRGTYTTAFIRDPSGHKLMIRTGTYHNIGVDWPIYTLPGRDAVVIQGGALSFEFWNQARNAFVDSYGDPRIVWLWGARGNYEGEVVGVHLAGTASPDQLLIKDDKNRVINIAAGKDGVGIVKTRRFMWPDGSTASPLALYEDLRLGFFLDNVPTSGVSADHFHVTVRFAHW